MARADIAVKVFPDTHDRLAKVKDQMEAERHRSVTFDEAVGYLLDFRDQVLGVSADATEAGR